MTFAGVITRIGIAAALSVSGISHAYLYIHGYRHIPMIGTAFLLQASVSLAVAVLILAGGSVVAFLLSRTVGLFGFSERGWQPSPHAVVDLVAELLIVGLWAAYLVIGRRARG
jgi:hypothetical protein